MKKGVLVTGAFGQVGTDLVPVLQKIHGKDNVIAVGHKNLPKDFDGIVEAVDCRDSQAMEGLIKKYNIGEVYHLAALISAIGEKNPSLAWDININSLKIFLDLAVEQKFKLFWSSSMAAMGPTTPVHNTPQRTVLEPITMYGVTKVAGELLCQYYFLKYGVDVRSIRYPGLLSWKHEPHGAGTTEYAVAIFYEGLQKGSYTYFVREDTLLPMMYMDDGIRATIQLMEAPADQITVRTSYNLAAISFTPKELTDEVKKHIPNLSVDYIPDYRQVFADSVPKSIDDSQARKDWGWKHEYDLAKMTVEMIEKLKEKLNIK